MGGRPSYIHCGIDSWAYLFKVEDVVSYATKENAMQSVQKALIKHPEAIDVGLRTDRGPQYDSESFRESMKVLGVKQEFIFVNGPHKGQQTDDLLLTIRS